ncbi:MAG: DUF4838 domain-containing protein [Ruminococcaceae bacterium]|nr:DUF4838 domain-containing protein [Oscillospiraceae bacterium]
MGIKIITNQQIAGKIVIPEAPISTEDYASTELRYYFNRMTANPAEIVKTNEAVDDALIVIGAALTNYGEERLTYADDELHWYTKNGKVFIDGGARGILYSMYDFLEALGCRFFTPKAEKVPTYKEFELEDTDKRDKPAFESREYYFRDTMRNQNFSVKCRTNETTEAKYGGPYRLANNCHSFYTMLPIDKYFGEHPEWYAMYDGKRGRDENRGGWQLCLSNPEVIEKIVECAREIMKRSPNAQLINIQQCDFGRSCECEKCRELDEKYGGPSGLMVVAANAVAEALEEEYPNTLIQIFGYSYTKTPPKNIKAHHNVIVQYCPINGCCAHPIDGGCDWAENENTRENIDGWSQVCDHLSIWDYNVCFWHLPLPYPNWHTLQPNMQYFFEKKALNIFSQGELRENDGCDLDELRCYLICKLMWDPYCDYNKHLTEFTDFYYGAAAPIIREYIETMCGIAEEEKICFACYGRRHPGNRKFDYEPFHELFAPEYLEKYYEILDRAEMAVRDDTIRRMRVNCIRLSLGYIDMRRRLVLNDYIDPAEFNQYIEDCIAHNITVFHAGNPHQNSVMNMASKYWR